MAKKKLALWSAPHDLNFSNCRHGADQCGEHDVDYVNILYFVIKLIIARNIGCEILA